MISPPTNPRLGKLTFGRSAGRASDPVAAGASLQATSLHELCRVQPTTCSEDLSNLLIWKFDALYSLRHNICEWCCDAGRTWPGFGSEEVRKDEPGRGGRYTSCCLLYLSEEKHQSWGRRAGPGDASVELNAFTRLGVLTDPLSVAGMTNRYRLRLLKRLVDYIKRCK